MYSRSGQPVKSLQVVWGTTTVVSISSVEQMTSRLQLRFRLNLYIVVSTSEHVYQKQGRLITELKSEKTRARPDVKCSGNSIVRCVYLGTLLSIIRRALLKASHGYHRNLGPFVLALSLIFVETWLSCCSARGG
jgi:hypothetical protein